MRTLVRIFFISPGSNSSSVGVLSGKEKNLPDLA
jgi:hypothetical protein